MFYCEPCRNTNGWPGAVPTSHGECEVCNTSQPCYDFPSYMLTPAKSEFDWATLHSTRRKIAELESQLPELYEIRKALIIEMGKSGMKQREIGAYWGISNPRVSQILNKESE